MRLCRFSLDEIVLAGFYRDDRVIPIDQAAEAYCEEIGIDLLLPSTDDLLDLLPPDGPSPRRSATLADWVDGLDEDGARRAVDPDRRGQAPGPDRPARQDPPARRATTPPTSSSGAGSRPSGPRPSPMSS